MCDGDTCYLTVMETIEVSNDELESVVTWNDERRARVSIYRDEDFELLVTCWEAGQKGGIHDYGADHAWTLVLNGALQEERFIVDPSSGNLEKVGKVKLEEGDFSYMGGGNNIHRMSNLADSRTIALHLYRRPVDSWNVYDETYGDAVSQKVWWDETVKSEAFPV